MQLRKVTALGAPKQAFLMQWDSRKVAQTKRVAEKGKGGQKPSDGVGRADAQLGMNRTSSNRPST